MHSLGDQVQPDMEHSRTTSATIELGFQWRQESFQYERQRLQPLNGPLKIERLLEGLFWDNRKQWPQVLTACKALPLHTLLPKPSGDSRGRQCRHVAERAKSPAAKRGECCTVRRGV